MTKQLDVPGMENPFLRGVLNETLDSLHWHKIRVIQPREFESSTPHARTVEIDRYRNGDDDPEEATDEQGWEDGTAWEKKAVVLHLSAQQAINVGRALSGDQATAIEQDEEIMDLLAVLRGWINKIDREILYRIRSDMGPKMADLFGVPDSLGEYRQHIDIVINDLEVAVRGKRLDSEQPSP